jgi:hypothetical protein
MSYARANVELIFLFYLINDREGGTIFSICLTRAYDKGDKVCRLPFFYSIDWIPNDIRRLAPHGAVWLLDYC